MVDGHERGASKRVRPVEVGLTISVPGTAGRAVAEVTVHPACGEQGGLWFCVTHNELFENQLQKDSHIHDGKHVLAWACRCGRIEAP